MKEGVGVGGSNNCKQLYTLNYQSGNCSPKSFSSTTKFLMYFSFLYASFFYIELRQTARDMATLNYYNRSETQNTCKSKRQFFSRHCNDRTSCFTSLQRLWTYDLKEVTFESWRKKTKKERIWLLFTKLPCKWREPRALETYQLLSADESVG